MDEIALVEVVGAGAAEEEFLHEGAHDDFIVVYVFEEDALVADHDAVIGETLEGGADFGGELSGVVGVNAEAKGVVLLEHLAEFVVDPLGEEDGDSGADANEFEVGDLAEAGEDFIEFPGGEEEGVAAGEEDVADLRVFLQVLVGGFVVHFELLIAGSADDAASGAVAAVGGAAVGDEEEDAIGVAVDEAGYGHVGVFAAGVGHFGGVFPGLFDSGDDLSTDGIERVAWIDEIEVVGGDGGGELGAGEEYAGALFIGEGDAAFDVLEAADAVFQLPFCGIPFVLSDLAFPVAEGVGVEFF